jgi:CRISPR-associated protein Cas5d
LAHRLHIWGNRACFRRPEFRRDFVSYDVITPLAAVRIFEAVHASPAISWAVERIDVLNPFRFDWTEEEGSAGRTGRRVRLLRDVSYVVTARFALTASAGPQDNAAKHAQMFRRKARQGRTARPPHLGLTQFPAHLALIEEASDKVACQDAELRGTADLGWLLFDHGDASGHSRFFQAQLRDGSISVPPPDAEVFAS